MNQLEKILEYTGEVHKADIESLESPVASQLVDQIRIRNKSFREYFGGVDPEFH